MKTGQLPPSSSRPGPDCRPEGPGLRRADSLPARLPSDPPRRAEVEPVRHPVTRPAPDAKPPVDFRGPGTGGMDEAAVDAAARRKIRTLIDEAGGYGALERKLGADPEAMALLKSRHPDYDRYTGTDKIAAAYGTLMNHPKYRAELALARNEVSSIPNAATGARMMRWDEQVFLTNAFEELGESFRKNPFHIHGETAMVGNREGRIVEMNYTPAAESSSRFFPGDRYQLHTHPPFQEPFTSSASGADHIVAADIHLLHGNRMESYVTNGKDVLHISPTGTALTRLIPDPKWEEKLVGFPEAFRVPDPEPPAAPFSNHESPAGFGPWDGRK